MVVPDTAVKADHVPSGLEVSPVRVWMLVNEVPGGSELNVVSVFQSVSQPESKMRDWNVHGDV